MITGFVALAAGLAMLLGGGTLLVRAAAALARRMGVSPLAVGMTVVAFGTSAPELAVNLLGSLRGDTAICFGNVVGSNIANLGLILALAALIRPLAVDRTVIRREIPMMLLASAAAAVLGLDRWAGAGPAAFGRNDGVVLLLLFSVFLYYTARELLEEVRAGRAGPAGAGATEGPLPLLAALLGIGIALLGAGGHVAVWGAESFARAAGVPEVVIGISAVAVGTSLPELATTVLAAREGKADLAVGNVVGSNIFNLLFIFGMSAAIRPVPLPPGGAFDLAVMVAISAVVLPMAFTGRGTLSRLEGGLLFAGYAAFLAARFLGPFGAAAGAGPA